MDMILKAAEDTAAAEHSRSRSNSDDESATTCDAPDSVRSTKVGHDGDVASSDGCKSTSDTGEITSGDAGSNGDTKLVGSASAFPPDGGDVGSNAAPVDTVEPMDAASSDPTKSASDTGHSAAEDTSRAEDADKAPTVVLHHSACQQCHERKVRCVREPGRSSCLQCEKRKQHCLPCRKRQQGRRRKGSGADDGIPSEKRQAVMDGNGAAQQMSSASPSSTKVQPDAPTSYFDLGNVYGMRGTAPVANSEGWLPSGDRSMHDRQLPRMQCSSVPAQLGGNGAVPTPTATPPTHPGMGPHAPSLPQQRVLHQFGSQAGHPYPMGSELPGQAQRMPTSTPTPTSQMPMPTQGPPPQMHMPPPQMPPASQRQMLPSPSQQMPMSTPQMPAPHPSQPQPMPSADPLAAARMGARHGQPGYPQSFPDAYSAPAPGAAPSAHGGWGMHASQPQMQQPPPPQMQQPPPPMQQPPPQQMQQMQQQPPQMQQPPPPQMQQQPPPPRHGPYIPYSHSDTSCPDAYPYSHMPAAGSAAMPRPSPALPHGHYQGAIECQPGCGPYPVPNGAYPSACGSGGSYGVPSPHWSGSQLPQQFMHSSASSVGVGGGMGNVGQPVYMGEGAQMGGPQPMSSAYTNHPNQQGQCHMHAAGGGGVRVGGVGSGGGPMPISPYMSGSTGIPSANCMPGANGMPTANGVAAASGMSAAGGMPTQSPPAGLQSAMLSAKELPTPQGQTVPLPADMSQGVVSGLGLPSDPAMMPTAATQAKMPPAHGMMSGHGMLGSQPYAGGAAGLMPEQPRYAGYTDAQPGAQYVYAAEHRNYQ